MQVRKVLPTIIFDRWLRLRSRGPPRINEAGEFYGGSIAKHRLKREPFPVLLEYLIHDLSPYLQISRLTVLYDLPSPM